jgi:periplasmic divalent cation tolerance protein
MTRDNAAMPDFIVVLCACGSESEAEAIARQLVERRLAACVNVLPNMRSVYRWKGQIESAAECLLVIKSSRPHFDALRAALEGAHSYELPEAIALSVVDASPAYLDWLDSSLGVRTE